MNPFIGLAALIVTAPTLPVIFWTLTVGGILFGETKPPSSRYYPPIDR